MKFHLHAECEFEAKDIDRAFLMLSDHFRSLNNDYDERERAAMGLKHNGIISVEAA